MLALIGFAYTACEQPADDTAAVTCQVTFTADGGSPEPAVQTVAKGGKITEPPLMVKPGYQFSGWYDTVQLREPAWDFAVNTVTGDITLYAGWVTFRAVTDITGVAAAMVQGETLILTGTVLPANATNKTITWTVKNGSATINNNNRLDASTSGTVIVTATITNGSAPGTAFSKDFTIAVWVSSDPRVDFLGKWYGPAGATGNPGYFESNITISAGTFIHLDGWGYFFDIAELEWASAVNTDAATQGEYPSGYTITGNILRRGGSGGSGDDIFNGATSITMFISANKQRLLIPAWTSINTASRYNKTE
jgi:uncharacterized repeat protein (TIGR02543 family)